MTNKVVLWVGGVVAVLLVAAIVVGVVLVNTIRAEADEQQYRDCMARHGFAFDEAPPAVTTDGELDQYASAISAAAEDCLP